MCVLMYRLVVFYNVFDKIILYTVAVFYYICAFTLLPIKLSPVSIPGCGSQQNVQPITTKGMFYSSTEIRNTNAALSKVLCVVISYI